MRWDRYVHHYGMEDRNQYIPIKQPDEDTYDRQLRKKRRARLKPAQLAPLPCGPQAGFSSSARRISTEGGAVSILLNSCIQLRVSSDGPAPLLRNWSS